MTYNFLYAFHERQGDTMLFQEERARAVRDVVRASAPDVLGVTEAVYCGAGRGRLIRPDYATMFGMPHVHACGFEGDWGDCLVSRFPIRHAERLPLEGGRRDVTSSALRATLDCDGREVHVVNFDFDSRDLLTLWLVGLPALHRRLQMQHHAALAMRSSASDPSSTLMSNSSIFEIAPIVTLQFLFSSHGSDEQASSAAATTLLRLGACLETPTPVGRDA